MNVGDIIVCIKEYYLHQITINSETFVGITIKVGEKVKIIDKKPYSNKVCFTLLDINVYTVQRCSDDYNKFLFYDKGGNKYMKNILEYFQSLAILRDKRIDDIFDEDN